MTSLRRSLFVLFLVVATELIGFGLIIPVLPQLAAKFNADHVMLGVLMASFSFAQFFSAPILGHLSDKYGRKPVLVLSKLGTVVAYIVLAFSKSYWMFLFARLLDGFTGGNIAVARAYIADVTTEKNRSKGMAIIGMSFGFGFIIGPALGGILHNDVNGQFVTCLVAAALSLLAMVLTMLLLEESKAKTEASQHIFRFIENLRAIKQPIVMVICGAYLFYMLVFSGFETTFVMFTETLFQLTTKQNSLLFMYAGIIGLIVQGYFSRKQFGSQDVLVFVGCVILACGFLGMSFSTSVLMLMFFMGFFSMGIAFINTFMPALLSCYTNAGNRGVVMGVYESIGSVSRIFGPLIAYSFSFQLLYLEYRVFAVVVFCVGVGVLTAVRKLPALD